jgi:outer membrane protein assembly factor BamB
MVGGVLYFSTPTNRIIAIDASTGKEIWVYNPGIDLKGNYSEVTSGVYLNGSILIINRVTLNICVFLPPRLMETYCLECINRQTRFFFW